MYICIEKYCSIFASSYCVLEVKFRVKTFVKQKKDSTTHKLSLLDQKILILH